MPNLQYYLFYSSNFPEEFRPLVRDGNAESEDLSSVFRKDYEHELQPLGKEIDAATVIVPDGTTFAGVIYGDGTHFRESHGRNYGILGDFERLSYDDLAIRDANGDIVAEIVTSHIDHLIPAVLPPESFGLQRKYWWNAAYSWCKS